MNRVAAKTLLLLSLIAATASAGCARRAVKAPPPAAPVTKAETPAKPVTPEVTPSAPSSDFATATAYFAYDSSVLSEAARAELDRAARALRGASGVSIVVEGHCDERGTVEYNQALGERRALAARAYLEAAGVDASRMRVISYGKDRPFDTGSSEAAWARNRCAHLVRQ